MRLVVEGIDGSGKSTLANLLSKQISKLGYSNSIVEWFKNQSFQSVGLTFTSQGAMTPEVLAAIHASSTLCLLKTSPKNSQAIEVWDRYIYTSYASCTVRGASSELMHSLVNLFPVPEYTVLLLCDPKVCFERITRRGGIKFFESGLDRLFRGRCMSDEIDRFKRGDISNQLVKEVFVETMTEWNSKLQEVVDLSSTMILREPKLEQLEELTQQIIEDILSRNILLENH